MSEYIVGILITAAASILAVIITNRSSEIRIMHEFKTHQAVTDTKMDELTREVREHNNFARRMPVVEEQIKVVNHRIADLEKEVRE